jgi:hypothetical protein
MVSSSNGSLPESPICRDALHPSRLVLPFTTRKAEAK